ncbi:hypothetical protein GGS24DRAFT_465729 [Hypoxylon argillaceum]|nr:hypothetical protein GGS24DRAFT_465729 [Hypoxylon argillaceum]
MIDNDSKYFCLSGDIRVGGPSTWHVIDWDRRRVVSVTMDGEQDDESMAIKHFSRYSSQLSPDIYRISVSDTGEIISAYIDSKNDQTYCVYYPFLHEIFLPEGIQTVRRDELEELERLGPDADLVAYPPCLGGSAKKVVFKYYFLWQYAQMSWKEMNLWMRLPRHPNIVPFDRIVVDELEGRVVGFTNDYVPGGTLEENKSRVFKLAWLQQLIKVVDELNLRYGIVHQDIAPRNLVVDEPTDSIMLFDFNFAARSSPPSPGEGEDFLEDRNDVKGVIFTTYEIITRDDSLRRIPHEEQNLDSLGLEWVQHPGVKLDHPVASYQLILQEWRERRAGDLSAIHPGDVPEAIDWPSMPKAPQKTISVKDAHGQLHNRTVDKWYERRQDVRDRGDKVLNWERPPQRLLDNGTRVLSTGEIIN